MWNEWLLRLQATLQQQAPPDPKDLPPLIDEDPSRFASALAALGHVAAKAPGIDATWWLDVIDHLGVYLADRSELWNREAVQAVASLHHALTMHPLPQARLLQILAGARSADAVKEWVELILKQPPENERYLGLAIGPLFQRLDYDPEWVFPRLLEGLSTPLLAAAVLDLANYLTRAEACDVHPARERRAALAELLGQVAQRLINLEHQPPRDVQEAQQLQALVGNAVALGVSLCDALALIGDSASVGKLNQALQPRHRRLRVEAAAALAKLGDEQGKAALLELAAEPVARLRVLQYAEELGVLAEVPEEHRNDVARAAGRLASWLSEPLQFGVAPGGLELLDHRQMYWPGGEELEDCFLFQFEYALPNGQVYRNVGLCGPAVHAFEANLSELKVDEIYAAFAGWQCEHEDIYEVPAEKFEPAHEVEVARLARRLHDEGYERIEARLLGFFLGQRVLVATAFQQGEPMLLAADERDTYARPQAAKLRPEDAYCIYKGRQLLRSFN